MTAPQDLTDERAAPAELTDELIDAHLSLAYASSVLTCEKWDHVVARRFFGLGAAVGAGLIDTAVPGAAAPLASTAQAGMSKSMMKRMAHAPAAIPAQAVEEAGMAQALRDEVRLVLTDPDSSLSDGAVRALEYIDAALRAATKEKQHAD